MKTLLGVLVWVCLLVLISTATAQAATTVYISPSQTTANLDESFSVNVGISTDANAYAAQFDLYFDKTRLNASGITEGSFLKQGGASTSCVVLSFDNSIGKISYACTRLILDTGVNGTGTLLTANFMALAAGTSSLGFANVLLADNNIANIPASVTNGTVKVNRPPSASNLLISPASPKKADNLTGSYSYSDADGDAQSGSQIRWYKDSILQSAYNDALIVPSSATAKGQKWYFAVTPRDGAEYGATSTSPNVTIGNTAPVLNAIGNKSVDEGQLLQFAVNGTDADGDALAYTAQNLPAGAGFASQAFSWTPSYTQAGTYYVTFNVSDGTERASETIKITVNNVNRAPNITSSVPASSTLKTREGSSLLFNHTSNDPDGDAVTYSWKLNGTEKSTAQSWLFSPTTADCGSKGVLLNVSDGSLAATKSWVVNVGLSGDVNGDRTVNIFDLAAVGLCYGQTPSGDCQKADINPGPSTDGTPEGNGQINIFDLATVGLNYGRTC